MKRRLRVAATSLTIILIVACAVRVGFAWDYTRQNPKQALSVIPFLLEAGNIAHSVATGNGFSSPFRVDTGPTAWLSPVYPLLLAGILHVFGSYTFRSYIAAVLLNIAFSTLTCVPIFFAGRRVGGPGLAATAAWLWALFPNAILIPFESIWDASLAALLAATILWATLSLADSKRFRAWCVYGLLWGFALMTTATLAALLPFLLGWLAYRSRRDGRGWLARPALAAAIAVLCCAPWTVRNYVEFHAFIPLRSGLGLQLWLGNNPEARDVWLGDLHPIHDSAERNHYTQEGEIAYMAEKQHAAIQYMRSHPLRVAQLAGRRFVAIWAGGTPHPLADFLKYRSLWFRTVLIFNLFVAIGAAAGIVLLFRTRSAYAFPVPVFPIIFPCVYYFTLAQPRYRHPIDPVILLLTAVTMREASLWFSQSPGDQDRAGNPKPGISASPRNLVS
ncbi:MAG: glycosyltransferase family 39 protein [Candidatus Acidiferrales bacterium]